MKTPNQWKAVLNFDGGFSITYEGRGKDTHGRWALMEDRDKQREAERLLIEAAPLMLDALQRITRPAADDSDHENALQVIAQATGKD
jgi:hypothetical protein